MKKIFCLLFIISIILAMIPLNCTFSAVNVEMIFNETFEGDLSRWTASGVDGVKNAELFDTERSYIKNCLIIYDKDDGTSCTLKSEAFDVTAGNTYTVAVDMKSKNEAQTKAHLVFFNEYNVKIQEGVFTVGAYGSDEWMCVSMWVDAPEDAHKAQVWLTYEKTDKSEDFGYFDNVIVCNGMVGFSKNFKLRRETSPLAYDDSNTVLAKEKIVLYDNFENGFKGWNPLSKSSSNKVYTSNTKAYTGIKSLRIISNSDREETGVESDYLNIVPNEEYSFSFDVSSIYDEGASISLCFYDKDKNKLSEEKTVSNGINWKKNEIVTKAPLDALYAKIIIFDKGDKKESYIDNIKLLGEKGTGNIFDYKSKYDLVLENSLILFLEKSWAYSKGKKVFIDSNNKNITPYVKEGRTLVPVRFIAESFGAEVLWDEKENEIKLAINENQVSMIPDDKTIKINQDEFETDVPPYVFEGRTYLPLRFFCEKVMDKTVFWDDRGLIVISDNEIIKLEDREIIEKLTESFK